MKQIKNLPLYLSIFVIVIFSVFYFVSVNKYSYAFSYDEVKKISKIHENSGKKDGIYDKQLFVDLSSYYNQADMKIGAGISFVTATLRYMGTTNKTTEAQNEG